jgi:hypothetical protein
VRLDAIKHATVLVAWPEVSMGVRAVQAKRDGIEMRRAKREEPAVGAATDAAVSKLLRNFRNCHAEEPQATKDLRVWLVLKMPRFFA